MPRGSATRQLTLELAQPLQLGPKLLNHEGDHPHRLMMRMADFPQNRAQRFLFASYLLPNELAAALHLLLENAGAREPGKRDPGGKRRMIPLCGPVLALEGVARCGAARGGGLKDGALGAGGRFATLCFANEAGGGKLFQRIVN